MRNHCTMAELSAVRNGEGSSWARQHLEGCASCQRELELLHQRVSGLRALPARRPPRDRWAEIRQVAEAERRSRRWQHAGWGALALAASVTLVVGVRALAPAGSDGGLVAGGKGASQGQELMALMAESQQLEAALHDYDPDGRVLNARAAGVIAGLEDRIALVDAGIAQAERERTSPDQVVNLWRSRVELMDALVNAHVTRVSYVGF